MYGIFDVMQRCGEWVLRRQAIPDIQHRVRGLSTDLMAEGAVTAMKGKQEATAMEVDQDRRDFRCG